MTRHGKKASGRATTLSRRRSRAEPPSKQTELKILYDEKNIYMAIRAYDDMAKVARYSSRRDEIAGDIVGVCFDSFFDKRTGFEFDLTSAGHEDRPRALATRAGIPTWDAVWDGKVAYEPNAWTAEFRVPLESAALRPSGRAGLGHARLALDRSLSRKRASGTSSRGRAPGACTTSASCTAFRG